MSEAQWITLASAAIGPLVTAILALFVINSVTARAQRRRDSWETRDALAAEIIDVGDTLYFALQRFWREAQHNSVALPDRKHSPLLADARSALDELYTTHRVKGRVLEQRLRIYYRDSAPSQNWHRAMSLLSARYFLLLENNEASAAEVRARNAGPRESGLSAEELKDPRVLMNAYRSARLDTIRDLWIYPVDRRGRHMSNRTIPDETAASEISVGQ
ncbi:hypothetical protein [Leifsonia sp. NPDC058248]|uniref:hypothetical protein n=1 Tax=Leifsonia sp. NPDC058248 TaxID=3346402 RepID=UPI0036D8EE9B